MTDRIAQRLKSSGVHAWEISDETTRGREYYFIRHRLDQNRIKDVRHIKLTVYETTDGGETIGSASAEVHLGADDAQIDRIIKDLSYRAGLVKNPYFKLNPPVVSRIEGEAPDLDGICGAFLTVFSQIPETPGEDVNSYEIFVRDVRRRYLNSNGTDVVLRYPTSMAEVIVNARSGGHEIELYRNISSGECDKKRISDTVAEAMRLGSDRLRAQPSSFSGSVPVVFSSAEARGIYEYFLDRLTPDMIFRRFSDWSLGEQICPDAVGDRVTVRTLAFLPGSSSNFAFDDQGAPVRDELLMEAGVPRFITGGRMFSYLMGIEGSFKPTNVVFEGGSKSRDEIMSGAFLEAVEFSDFQVDPITGDVFGEIRLGYMHDGKGGVTPVTGGSVSGSMNDFLKNMTMSVETISDDDMVFPRYTRFEGVTVA